MITAKDHQDAVTGIEQSNSEEEVADGAVGELELKKEPTPEQGEK